MYKVIMFLSDPHFSKIQCLNQLAEFLNKFEDIAVVDIEKEWSVLNEYQCTLTCYITICEFDEED